MASQEAGAKALGSQGDDGSMDPPTLGGEGTCAPSPWAGQESAQAHDAYGMGQRFVCPPRLGSCPMRGAVSPGCVPPCGSGQRPVCPQPGQESGVSFQTLKKCVFAAAGFLLLPRRLRKSFCLQCSSTSAVRTGKIPLCSQEHHRQVSQLNITGKRVKFSCFSRKKRK